MKFTICLIAVAAAVKIHDEKDIEGQIEAGIEEDCWEDDVIGTVCIINDELINMQTGSVVEWDSSEEVGLAQGSATAVGGSSTEGAALA